MRLPLVVFGLASVALVGLVSGCPSDDDGSPSSSNSSSSSSGMGGSGASGGAGGSSSSAGGSGGTGGSGGDACLNNPVMEHLLVSEVATHPGEAEFIEIWNRSSEAIDLSNVHISDNSEYHTVTEGPWVPITSNPGTDFLVRFPAGSTIAAGARMVIQLGAANWATTFPAAPCPDFILYQPMTPLSCGGNMTPEMDAPANGESGNALGSMLSNAREMVMLFCWDGQSAIVHDIDYVAWGAQNNAGARVDKTAVSGYLADTAADTQQPAPEYMFADPPMNPGEGQSIGRCDAVETGETMSGGNGIAGHDETSETMSTSFQIHAVASPGAANICN